MFLKLGLGSTFLFVECSVFNSKMIVYSDWGILFDTVTKLYAS